MDAEFCKEKLFILRSYADDSLSGMRHYLKTMQDFIDKQEEYEVKAIEASFPKGTEINWSYHYPIHWEEIFTTQLRSSFVVSLVSLTEWHLNMICKHIMIILDLPIKHNELRGNIFHRGRKYLEIFAKYKKHSEELWRIMELIYEVRNCIVHNNNDLENMQSAKKLSKFIEEQPGLSLNSGFLEIQAEFPIFCIDTIQEFILSLYDELEHLCGSLRTGKLVS